ncbi:MAG: hypothetical protein H6718_12355 [Polyangiaceae bacterium]|nr:hypothetical protein [Myxococcales bacterium]MCB9586185.1 hypothetical protein [Polyangiaceae bacterium]MCB9606862.1 hypothetical protein [Polyangiaceae bacterium]
MKRFAWLRFGCLCFGVLAVAGCDGSSSTAASGKPDAGQDAATDGSGGAQDAGGDGDSGSVAQCSLTPEMFADEDAPFGLTLSEGELWWSAVSPGGYGLRHLGEGQTEPETVLERATGLAGLAVQDGKVFFTDRASETVHSWDATTGEQTLAGVPGVDDFTIAVEGESAYVVAHGDDASGFTHQIFRVPTSGGSAEPLGSISVGQADGDLIHGLKSGSEGIYWTSNTGSLFMVDRMSGGVTERLAISDGIRSWDLNQTASGDEIWFMRWTDDPEIWVLRAGASDPEQVLAQAHGRTALHFHAGIVYWSQVEGIFALDATADSPQALSLAAVDGVSVTSIIDDGSQLFWANSATRDFGGGLGRACLGLP